MPDGRLDRRGAALYQRLYETLRGDICSGVYRAGDALPTEDELCRRYGLSRVTVRKALVMLDKEGLLTRKRGVGTFVRPGLGMFEAPTITSFAAYCERSGHTAQTRLVDFCSVPATQEDQRVLGVAPGDGVMASTRIRFCDGSPVMLEYNRYAPALAFLTREHLEGSLYQAMARREIRVDKATHVVSLCYAQQKQAELLDVPVGAALIHLYECMYDERYRPLHTSEQYIRGDRFAFRI